ncbi:hypothetical protein D1872_311320 [compost metagenome]
MRRYTTLSGFELQQGSQTFLIRLILPLDDSDLPQMLWIHPQLAAAGFSFVS